MYNYECKTCGNAVKIPDKDMEIITTELSIIGKLLKIGYISTLHVLDGGSKKCCYVPDYYYVGLTEE